MNDKPAINTNVRLFDLVRYMRSELHQADLITEEEYGWLCLEAPMARGGGSPSARRLEDYDELRRREKTLRDALKRCGDAVAPIVNAHRTAPENAIAAIVRDVLT